MSTSHTITVGSIWQARSTGCEAIVTWCSPQGNTVRYEWIEQSADADRIVGWLFRGQFLSCFEHATHRGLVGLVIPDDQM